MLPLGALRLLLLLGATQRGADAAETYTEVYKGLCEGGSDRVKGVTQAACQAACSKKAGCESLTNSAYTTWARSQNCTAGNGTATLLANDCKKCPVSKSPGAKGFGPCAPCAVNSFTEQPKLAKRKSLPGRHRQQQHRRHQMLRHQIP